MARTAAPPTLPQRSQTGSAVPWIVFVFVMVAVMTAGLAAIIVTVRPGSGDQPNPGLQLNLPTPPAYKMPASPPAKPHSGL